jgi:leader peptidase (prepilin peptidase)/N-methyltransferase
MITIPFGLFSGFVLGAIIGSFLNVVILRMNTGKGLTGRSICFSCSRTLSTLELIPIVSFFAQGCKCRGCKRRISWQYPIVEIVTGLIFALIISNASMLSLGVEQWLSYSVFYAIAFSLLVVIAGYDMRHKIIPDKAVYAFISLSFFAPLVTFDALPYFGSAWIDHIVAGLALALPFALIWFFSRGRLMGFGDAKLALGIGFLLGLSQGVAAIMLAFWIGAVVGVILLLLKRTNLTIKSEIPFAPFLALGGAIAFLFHVDLYALALIFTWS